MFPRRMSLLEVRMSCRFVLPGCDSSLNLFVLVFVSGTVSLSQVGVAFSVLDLSVVEIYRCVGFHHHLRLRLVHLQALIVTFIT